MASLERQVAQPAGRVSVCHVSCGLRLLNRRKRLLSGQIPTLSHEQVLRGLELYQIEDLAIMSERGAKSSNVHNVWYAVGVAAHLGLGLDNLAPSAGLLASVLRFLSSPPDLRWFGGGRVAAVPRTRRSFIGVSISSNSSRQRSLGFARSDVRLE